MLTFETSSTVLNDRTIKKMTSGEMAKKVGVSQKAIRLYDNINE